MAKCVVCLEHEKIKGWALCDACERNYSRVGWREFDLIQWTAKRTRQFERKRQRATRGRRP